MRIFDLCDLLGRADANHFAAVVARFWSKIDNPISRLNDFEIVFDHNDRVSALDQALKNPQQHRNIVEMETCCRLIENKQVAARSIAVPFDLGGSFGFGQVPDQFQTLRFAARKSVERLAESQITETDFIEYIQRIRQSFLFADLREELDRLAYGPLQHVVDRFAVQFNFQDVRLETFAFTFRAAHIKIAQELHLDLFEPRARTALAAAAAGIERERARGQTLRHRFRLCGEKFADAIVKSEIKNRRSLGRRAQRRFFISDFTIASANFSRSEEHTSELQSRRDLVCRLLLEKKNK